MKNVNPAYMNYAREDADSILCKIDDPDMRCSNISANTTSNGEIAIKATFATKDHKCSISWNYRIERDAEGEYIATSKSIDALADKIMAAISTTSIMAADEDFDDDEGFQFNMPDESADDTELEDTVDDISDQVEDLADQVDEVEEDPVDIETDNNISNHYIAECDSCHGVFISAVIQSDQVIDHISGICPLCGNETEQYLKWIIKDAEDEVETSFE